MLATLLKKARSHKYIRKYLGKNGKWIYMYHSQGKATRMTEEEVQEIKRLAAEGGEHAKELAGSIQEYDQKQVESLRENMQEFLAGRERAGKAPGTPKDFKATAKEMGRQAFKDGSNATPAQNKKLMDFLSQNAGSDLNEIMKEWQAGWTAENLKSPIEAPKETQRKPVKSSNMIGPISFNKTPKKLQAQITQYIHDADKIVASMGVEFKRPIKFHGQNLSSTGKRTRGTYAYGSHEITIKDRTGGTKTLMHEIGHAVDYSLASADSRASMTRSKEITSANTELAKKYDELTQVVLGSAHYESHKAGRHARYLRTATEVFARAFEVYSWKRASDMEAKGEITKGFTDTFVPDVFTEKDLKVYEEKQKLDSEYNFVKKQLKNLQRAKSHLRHEAMLGSMKETDFLPRLTQVDGDIKAKISELNTAAKAYNALKTPSREVTPEKRDEYVNKITKLMDYILKNDEIKKALKNLILFRKADLEGTEATRLGTIVGHTKAGREVYSKFNHEAHEDFTEEDHEDAVRLHQNSVRNLSYSAPGTDKLKHFLFRQIAGHRSKLKSSMQKAIAEGSRGGKVIGHTRSGKAVYARSKHPSHDAFTAEDHSDAAKMHKLSSDPSNPIWHHQMLSNPKALENYKSRKSALKEKRAASKEIKRLSAEIKAKMSKAIATSEVSGIDINTAEHSQDQMASRGNPWIGRLKEALRNFKLGEVPRKISLGSNGEDAWELVASQEDDGIYSGFVRNANASSGDYGQVVFEIKKMTMPQMVQALMAKEYITDTSLEKQPGDHFITESELLAYDTNRISQSAMRDKLRALKEKNDKLLASPAKPIRIMLIQGGARSKKSCPGEDTKSLMLVDYLKALAPEGVVIDILDLAVTDKDRIIRNCKNCVGTANGFHCQWATIGTKKDPKRRGCSCYGPESAAEDLPDLLHDEHVYYRLEQADGFIVVTPTNWGAPSSSLKAMFDRLVCANLAISREDAVKLTDNDIKNPDKTQPLERSKQYEHLKRNHLEGKIAGFFMYGVGGADDYANRPLPKSMEGYESSWDAPNSSIQDIVDQCRYSGIYVPEELVQIHTNNSHLPYTELDARFRKADYFKDSAKQLFLRLISHIRSLKATGTLAE